MTFSSLRPAPLISFRHASVGTLGERGLLPTGWKGDNVAKIEVLEIDFAGGKPGATIRLGMAASSSTWSSLSLGPHLATAKHEVIALVGQVSLHEWKGIDEARLCLREWRVGGEMVRQADWPFHLAPEPQVGAAALETGADGRAVQPMILLRRKLNQTGQVTLTFAGLAFGSLQKNPRWLWA